MQVIILSIRPPEVGWCVNVLAKPIAITMRTGGRARKTRSAGPTRNKIGIDNTISFRKRLAETIMLHVLAQAIDLAYHLVAENAAKIGRNRRTLATPHV